MSTTEQEPTDQDAGEPSRNVSRAAKVGWGIYQQVATVLATFGIVAMIGHFWVIGWRGFLRTVVGVWSQTIRPATEWVFHILVSVPLGWLGVDFVVPLWVRDYLSVGLIFALASTRLDLWGRLSIRGI